MMNFSEASRTNSFAAVAPVAIMAAVGALFLTSSDKTSRVVEHAPQQGGGALVHSHCQHAESLRELHEGADIVIEGMVLDVRYALSQPTGPEGDLIPHTFVTYRVDESFKGTHPGETVTLRFIGGEAPNSDEYLMTSIVPQFDVGDRDVLFVTGNTTEMSPLVRRRSGRMRLIDEEVYTDDGRSVRVEADESLSVGDVYDLEPVRTTRIHGNWVETRTSSRVRQRPSDAMSATELRGVMRNLALEPAAPRQFVNANPNQPFAGPDFTPSGPPAERESTPMPEDERAERARASQDAIRRESRDEIKRAKDQSFNALRTESEGINHR